MMNSKSCTLAVKYVVDDLLGARQIGGRLHSILGRIEAGSPVSQVAREYLSKSGLSSLHALVEGQIDLDTFKHDAVTERELRIVQADLARRKAEADAEQLKAERAALSAAIFNDPAYKRRQESKQFRRKFGLRYVELEHFSRIMRMLKLLDKGQRLSPREVVWIQTEAEECWTHEVACTWHKIEAEALTEAWRTTGDPWNAVNASSHWRKCEQPEAALRLTEEALAAASAPTAKLQSALATTRGGALRDVQRYAEAKASAEQAHMLMPKDYRPCTLLGAVYFDLGELTVGLEWFRKAEELGAPEAMVDHEIRSSLARLPQKEREQLQAVLLAYDPKRFASFKSKRRFSR